MAISRYKNTVNVDKDYHDIHQNFDPSQFQTSDDIYYKFKDRDRIDQLARRHLGDGKYWWVICLVNGFNTPFDPNPGDIIRIPRNLSSVLNRI
jgi:nucleoid-associated protein YgaU